MSKNIVIVGAGRRIRENYTCVFKDLQKEGIIKITNVVDKNKNNAIKFVHQLSSGSEISIKALEDLTSNEDLSDSLVIIATPVSTHKKIIKELTKNKPWRILVEKPLAGNLKDFKDMEKLIHDFDMDVRIAYHFRFSPVFRHFLKLEEFLRTKENLNYIYPIIFEFNKIRAISKRPSIGVLRDCISHFIDMINYLSPDSKIKVIGKPILYHSEYVRAEIQKEYNLHRSVSYAADINLKSNNGKYFQIKSHVFKIPRERYIHVSLYDKIKKHFFSLGFDLENDKLYIAQTKDKKFSAILSYRHKNIHFKEKMLQSFIDKMPITDSIALRKMLISALSRNTPYLCTVKEESKNMKLIEDIESYALIIKS